jgi:hypothetical protein
MRITTIEKRYMICLRKNRCVDGPEKDRAEGWHGKRAKMKDTITVVEFYAIRPRVEHEPKRGKPA